MGYETEAFGTGGKNAFYSQPTPFKSGAINKSTSKGGGINLGSLLGGLFGGRNKTVDYAQQDFERQKQLMDKMYEMSAPYSTYGVTGSNVVDQDGKTITSSLSPELQAQYDALLGRAGMTADRVAQLSGNPQELQQAIYQEQQALLQPSQDQARAQLDEQQIARGIRNKYWYAKSTSTC
jgi:hypothetical protein